MSGPKEPRNRCGRDSPPRGRSNFVRPIASIASQYWGALRSKTNQ